ncbi:MAG TPA: hypothetical protein VK986_10255, partial [Tepidisphaeraceae bacterium]|nr:hypothetical protein [Tepidisphaeraceae bacterium]
PAAHEMSLGANLGLYSITPNNKLEFDYPTLLAYKDFRLEAEAKGFRHFLEVFDPNACGDHCPQDLGRFVNDLIVRTLAGVPSTGRPVFLKIVYHGPKAMEELATYDPLLVPGILGGSSGTTYDAFKLLVEAKRYGARAALYGRKINNSEHQLTFVRFLSMLTRDEVTPEEAVRAYHGELAKLGIKPYRPLADDSQLTTTATSYAGGSSVTVPERVKEAPAPSFSRDPKGELKATPKASAPNPEVRTALVPSPVIKTDAYPTKPDGTPDFKKMTPAQKVMLARQKIQSDLSTGNETGNGARPRRF